MTSSTQTPAATQTIQQPFFWITTLALVLAAQPVTTDLYLSTLPTLAEAFAVSQQAIDSTLQSYLIAFAVVQLFVGPFADRFGRKPVLVFGLITYGLASLLGVWSDSLGELNVCRMAQALGVCISVICGRAMVRDLLEPQAGATLMSKSMGLMGLIALLCPMIGGLLLAEFNWQACFAAMAIYGFGVALWFQIKLPETLKNPDIHALKFAALFRNYLEIASHRQFLLFTVISTGSYSALMAFFAKASAVWIVQFGLTPVKFGILTGICSGGFILGTFLARQLLKRWVLTRCVLVGTGLCLTGSAVLLLTLLKPFHGPYWFLLGQFIYMLGHGINQPISQSGSVGFFPEKAGAAGSVMGFIVHVGAALWLAGVGLAAAPIAWPVGVACASLLIAIAAIMLQTKSNEP